MISKFLDVIAFIIAGVLTLGMVVLTGYMGWEIICAWEWRFIWEMILTLGAMIAFMLVAMWAYRRVVNKL